MFLPHIKNNQEINKKIDNLDKNRIIFENEDILIYNKPSGLLMHGSDNSLELQVNEYLKDKIIETLSFSTGPLHRLDRNTQGLVVFSVSLKGARTFTMLIQNRSIRKKYIAIVDGRYNKKEIWEDRLSRDEKSLKTLKDTNGKYAKSIFTPIYSYKNMTLAVIEIETGRTHQIRAHASIHNRPLTGDKKYGSQSGYNSYFLSAASLTFTQKSDILTEKTFTIPLDLKAHPILKELLNSNNIQVVKDLIKRELNSL
ncbi:MAG: hypothetical protein B6229_01220 [Spirochaetaceae bacterium 4572_7]|nr:MAG: hypothetical protein B6229_01220 [Spirochaetaceae bacterium 4572_7]